MKTAEEFIELPYHFCLLPDADFEGSKGWFIRVLELEGCMSQGRTPDEAIVKARDAMLGWISVALEDGQDIPLPFPEDYDHDILTVSLPIPVLRPLQRRAMGEKRDLHEVAADFIAAAVASEFAAPASAPA